MIKNIIKKLFQKDEECTIFYIDGKESTEKEVDKILDESIYQIGKWLYTKNGWKNIVIEKKIDKELKRRIAKSKLLYLTK